MTKKTDSIHVRNARMEAKKLAKQSEITHQQALDRVAQKHGHTNWSAFLKAQDDSLPVNTAKNKQPETSGDFKKRMLDEIETDVLETEAADQRYRKRVPPLLAHVGTAVINVTIFSLIFQDAATFVMLGITALTVILASVAANKSEDGLFSIRRAMRFYVTPAAFTITILSVVFIVVAVMQNGLASVFSNWSDQSTITQAALWAYSFAMPTYFASSSAHRVMVLASPETVQPAKGQDETFAASAAVASPAVALSFRVFSWSGIAIAIAGVFGLFWCAFVLVTGQQTDISLTYVPMAAIMGGIFLAFIGSIGFDLDKPSPAFVILDASRRAAKAKRFLSIKS